MDTLLVIHYIRSLSANTPRNIVHICCKYSTNHRAHFWRGLVKTRHSIGLCGPLKRNNKSVLYVQKKTKQSYQSIYKANMSCPRVLVWVAFHWHSIGIPLVFAVLLQKNIKQNSEFILYIPKIKNECVLPAQEWTNRTLIGHEPLICSKMCFSKRNWSNNKNQWYNILVTFIFKFSLGLY